jgi:hypothetical protein
MSVRLPLTDRHGTEVGTTLVDEADARRFVRCRFWIDGSGYVCTWFEGRKERLHRLIAAPQPGQVVDHINGNPLDNRRCNLRACAHRDNIRNQRARSDGTSKYRGVSFNSRTGKWVAGIKDATGRRHLGYFAVEEGAARAYDREALVLFGEFARLNFPEEVTR